MNKQGFISELVKQTNLSENECIILNDCLEENFLIGKKNKEKTIKLLMDKLNVDEEKANKLYETSSSIIAKNIKDKIIHPFKSQD
jgi:predicted metal-binding transcription factor (methanogenesis marker protein 9)